MMELDCFFLVLGWGLAGYFAGLAAGFSSR